MRKIKYIFIHSSATPQTWTTENFNREWKNKGWKMGGYHYIIYPDGTIEHAINDDLISNGVRGYNRHSVNVAYVGGIDAKGQPTDNRTALQKKAMLRLIRTLKTRLPNAVIMGHRDIWGNDPRKWQKMCPCFDVRQWMRENGL